MIVLRRPDFKSTRATQTALPQQPQLSPAKVHRPMPETVDSLILDLLEWVGPRSRPYAEVMDAWRTSCPRLPVWEDATERGFLEQHHEPDRGRCISLSALGAEHLRQSHRLTHSA